MSDLAALLALPASAVAVETLLRLNFRDVLGGFLGTMRAATALMRDATLDDDARQAGMAEDAGRMLAATLKLFAIIAAVLAGFAAVVWAGAIATGLAPADTLVRADLQVMAIAAAILWLKARAHVFG
ncbi:MAG: hypothetical protein K8F59_09575 [Rhodobacteraceae bacterium]|nr:hypothetical protein [Paracoccaceae bacterium]